MIEPLVEACGPKRKTLLDDLRRTMSVILWRHQSGAKWRAAQILIRWARAGA